jgi:dynein heavy chain
LSRNEYRAVAVRGSIIYFVIDNMAEIDYMYQNSLQYVQKLFNLAIKNAPRESKGIEIE